MLASSCEQLLLIKPKKEKKRNNFTCIEWAFLSEGLQLWRLLLGRSGTCCNQVRIHHQRSVPSLWSLFFKFTPTWSSFGGRSLEDSIWTVGNRGIGSEEQEKGRREPLRGKAAPAAFDRCESETVLRRSGAAGRETDGRRVGWRDGRTEAGRRMGNQSYVGAEGQTQPRSMGDD